MRANPQTSYAPTHTVRVELELDLPGGPQIIGARVRILVDPRGDTQMDLENIKSAMKRLTRNVEDAVREALR